MNLHLSQKHLFSSQIVKAVLILLLLGITACQQKKGGEEQIKNTSNAVSSKDIESRLVLNNATLEQSNAAGNSLWKIQVAEAVYSKNKETAQLKKVKGNIYQKGKIVLYISADKGEIYKGGEEIFLKENIIATDPRNGAVIRSQEVEWNPKESLLIVRKDFKGSHAKLEASATEGRYKTTEQKVELIGNVLATGKEPKLQLKTEHLFWTVPKNKLESDRPIKLARYKGNDIIDQIVADRGEVDLNAKTVIIQKNIEYKSVEPPIQIASNWIVWNYRDRIVSSTEPVQLFDYKQQITITGNKGQVDLTKEVAYLKEGVQGVNNRSQAKLYAQEMTWNMPNQIVQGLGNVIYEQNNPQLNVTGDKAIGNFKDDKIVVTSQSQDRVVTEIYPKQ